MPLTDRMEQRSHVAGSFVCPSCGESGKATKEHVIGQRFRREFPSIGRHVERFGNYSEPQAYSSPVNVDGRWVEQNVRRGRDRKSVVEGEGGDEGGRERMV